MASAICQRRGALRTQEVGEKKTNWGVRGGKDLIFQLK